MASVELGENKKIVLDTGIFLFNGNAPLIYCFDFSFLKFSLYSTFEEKAILRLDINSISFINCIAKVLLVISDYLDAISSLSI